VVGQHSPDSGQRQCRNRLSNATACWSASLTALRASAVLPAVNHCAIAASLSPASVQWRASTSGCASLSGANCSSIVRATNRCRPLIAPLLNLPPPAEYSPLALSPEQQRRLLLATLVEWVLGSARAQPPIIATEDLLWVDPSTLELIRLVRR